MVTAPKSIPRFDGISIALLDHIYWSTLVVGTPSSPELARQQRP